MIIAPKAKCIERVRSSPERAHTADILVGVIDRRLNSYEPAGRPRPSHGQGNSSGTELLMPAAGEKLTSWPVSTRVNKTGGADDALLIASVGSA